MTKKSYATSSKYLIQSVNNMRKYVTHGRRAGLTIGSNQAGLHADGSNALYEVFLKHKHEFEMAARKDNKDLNDEDDSVVRNVLPSVAQSESVVPSFFSKGTAPFLPYPVSLLSEDEAMKYLLPIIRKELAVHKSLVVSRIRWGDPKHAPQCWPETVASWITVSNPAHGQKVKHSMPMVEILKLAITNHLVSEGIDPEQHIDPQMDQKMLQMKNRARGFKISQPKATQVANLPPVPQFEDAAVSEQQGPVSHLTEEAAVLQPVPVSHLAEEPAVLQQDATVTGHLPPVPSAWPPVTLEEEEPMDFALNSEVFEESFEKDDDGRFVPAQRPAPPLSPVPPPSLHDSPPQITPPPPQHTSPPQITPPPPQHTSPLTSPMEAMRPSTSRHLFPPDTSSYGKGRGKGGHKILIQRDKLIVANGVAEQKKSWNNWKSDYTKALQAEIKNKRLHDTLSCKRCKKLVEKSTYVQHNIKNCKSLHPWMKWFNFKLQFE